MEPNERARLLKSKGSVEIRVVKMLPNVRHCALGFFSSHRKNRFAARCEYLHLIKKTSQ